MKKLFTKFLIIMVLPVILIGCSKESNDEAEKNCLITSDMIFIEPICSFDPRQATTVQFPVRVLINGEVSNQEDYDYDWSKDPNFKGSAISVSFEQLPLTLSLTEISTGCEVEATLVSSYWD